MEEELVVGVDEEEEEEVVLETPNWNGASDIWILLGMKLPNPPKYQVILSSTFINIPVLLSMVSYLYLFTHKNMFYRKV